MKAALQVDDSSQTVGSFQFSWDNQQPQLARRLARLDRIYLFKDNSFTPRRKLLHCVIKGDTICYDHFPVITSILLEDSPMKACKWKMSSFLLEAASLEIISLWQPQPPGTPFFKKLWIVLKFYKAFYQRHAKSLWEDENDLKSKLEACNSILQNDPGDGDLHNYRGLN